MSWPRRWVARRSRRSANDKLAKKLAPFAEQHKLYVAFHNHTNNVPKIDNVDPLLDYGQYIMFNFDIGHYVAGTKGKSPIPVIEKYHDRIISLHLKDRTPDGGNLPWGEGKTPIKEVLLLLKKEKWPIYGDIELEYKIPRRLDVRCRSGQVRGVLPGDVGVAVRYSPARAGLSMWFRGAKNSDSCPLSCIPRIDNQYAATLEIGDVSCGKRRPDRACDRGYLGIHLADRPACLAAVGGNGGIGDGRRTVEG